MIDWTHQYFESDEVIYSVDNNIQLDSQSIDNLIKLASQNSRKRIRLCAHKNPDDQIHEMVIVHPHDAYVRPHLHVNRTESMLILMGEVDYILFDVDFIIILLNVILIIIIYFWQCHIRFKYMMY